MRRREAQLDKELRLHLDELASSYVAQGIPRQEAERRARLEFGGIEQVKEECRDSRTLAFLDTLLQDLRYGWRILFRSPGFTLVAVLSLALGIGANTAIFTALDAILWRPLPVADPQRLVEVSVTRTKGRRRVDLPAAIVTELRRSGAFASIVERSADGLSFAYNDRAERIGGEFVSPEYFDFLGLAPALGQGFSSDVRHGRWQPEAVLSYRFWKRRFVGDPSVIGRVIHLNTVSFTIVGVSSARFYSFNPGYEPDLRLPVLPAGRTINQLAQLTGAAEHEWMVSGRLKPGWSLAQTEAAADAAFQELLQTTAIPAIQHAEYLHLRLRPIGRGEPSSDLEQFETPLFVLLGLVVIVLLATYANVASMLLARALARRRELAVRVAIGAGRGRLIRQMLVESLLLSLLGGIAAVAVSNWVGGLLVRFLPQGHTAIVVDLTPDSRALFFTFGLALLSGVVFGLAPALQTSRGNLADSLKSDSAASIGGGRGAGIRKILVVCQIAFSVVLLVAAGLFVRTLSNLRPLDYPSPERVLLFTMKPPPEIYGFAKDRLMIAELLRRVSAIPGVQSAAIGEAGPLASRQWTDPVRVADQEPVQAATDQATPGFFAAIGLPLVAGRDFRASDTPAAPRVAIINQKLARELFRNENPIGRVLEMPPLGAPLPPGPRRCEIIGVVGDSHYHDLRIEPGPAVWLAFQDYPPYLSTLHVRLSTLGTFEGMAAIRREFDAVDRDVPVSNIRTLAEQIDDSLSRERMVAQLSAAFGTVALLLAAIGLYGILAFSVESRRREIGIRMALGSSSSGVIALIARETLAIVAAGSVIGIAAAIGGARAVAARVVGVSPLDSLTLAASLLVIAAVSAAAVAIPAYRAARVDPMVALKYE
jgi:predicted permease